MRARSLSLRQGAHSRAPDATAVTVRFAAKSGHCVATPAGGSSVTPHFDALCDTAADCAMAGYCQKRSKVQLVPTQLSFSASD